jgi:hypothetical protein
MPATTRAADPTAPFGTGAHLATLPREEGRGRGPDAMKILLRLGSPLSLGERGRG